MPRDSFDSLFAAYKNTIYSLAYRMTGERQAAEDIVQETFLQVWKNQDRFKGESRILTWIYAIAKNLCYRHYARKKRSSFQDLEALLDRAAADHNEPRLEEPQREDYILQVKEGCLLGLLRCLSFHQRLAFILNTLFDVPVETVSRIIRKSPNATRILVHRARQGITSFLCKHCSLYDNDNPCHCADLINFSLKQGWIGKAQSHVVRQAESELSELKQEIRLYKSLPDSSPSPAFDQKMAALLRDKKFLIFSRQKVK